MAELGVVASVVGIASFAIQIGDSVLKLKAFWGQVKEAPEEVKWLLEEIETLGLVLANAGSNRDSDGILQQQPASSERCLALCRKAADNLESVVRDMDAEIRKRKRMGSLKMALKKDLVERLKERLRSAQFILMHSNQIYSEALQKQRHEIQRQWAELQQQELIAIKLSTSRSKTLVRRSDRNGNRRTSQTQDHRSADVSRSRKSEESQSLVSKMDNVNKAQKRQRLFTSRISGPRWLPLFNSVLEVSACKAPCGWTFSIKHYNNVSRNSPGFQAITYGDLSQLQSLLTERKASLFDIDEDSTSMFERALRCSRLDITKFLLSQGAHFISDSRLRLILNYASFSFSFLTLKERLDMLRYIAPLSELEEEPNDMKLDLLTRYYSCGGFEPFSWIVQQSSISFRGLSLQECIDHAAALLVNGGWKFQEDAALLLSAVFDNQLTDALACELTDVAGTSLLHALAWNLRCHILDYSDNGSALGVRSSCLSSQGHDYFTLLKTLATGGNDLHSLCLLKFDTITYSLYTRLQTPLMMVISGCCLYSRRCPETHMVNDTVEQATRKWLEQLKATGVDLVKYGQREQEAHIHRNVSREWLREDQFRDVSLRLISFSYGPEPGDWHLYFTQVMKSYFLQFWEMVDHPERALPGAWVDDENKYHPNDEWMLDYEPEFDPMPTESDCDVFR